MYFTVAELNLMLLRRQWRDVNTAYGEAKRRGWKRIVQATRKELERLSTRVANQELYVAKDNVRRSEKKTLMLERLA